MNRLATEQPRPDLCDTTTLEKPQSTQEIAVDQKKVHDEIENVYNPFRMRRSYAERSEGLGSIADDERL